MKSLADQLRDAIANKQTSVTEIALASGVHRVSLQHFLAGRRELPLRQIEALAHSLGYTVELVPASRKKKY